MTRRELITKIYGSHLVSEVLSNRKKTFSKRDFMPYRDEILRLGSLKKIMATGGSTGQIFEFPTGIKERKDNYVAIRNARKAWGIDWPCRATLVWGHSHLLSKSRTASLWRQCKLFFQSRNILSAYKLDAQSHLELLNLVESNKSKVVIGYTSALLFIAHRILASNMTEFSNSLRLVIVTAEYCSENDLMMIERAFGVPVAIEYGAAEVGAIGYSMPDKKDIYLIRDDIRVDIEDGKILVSTLNERLFPFWRYEIDATQSTDCENVRSLSYDFGRRDDDISFRLNNEDVFMHSETLVHLLRTMGPRVFQAQCLFNGKILEITLCVDNLARFDSDSFLKKLRLILCCHPIAIKLKIRGVEDFKFLISGKRKNIIFQVCDETTSCDSHKK